MDWWQTVGLMATLVATATAVATLGWRIMLRLQREIAEFRDELRADMAKLRDGLRAEMAKVRTDLGADIVSGRDGLVSVGEGLAELRGEVRDVQKGRCWPCRRIFGSTCTEEERAHSKRLGIRD